MCCVFSVDSTLGKEAIRAMLDLSGFKQVSEAKWSRQFPDRDGRARFVVCNFYGIAGEGQIENIRFNLSPSIGGHSLEEHVTGAIEAAFICQLMQVIQEKSTVFGYIKQHSLIGACGMDNERSGRLLKPLTRLMTETGRPLEQDDYCMGFKSAMRGGIGIGG